MGDKRSTILYNNTQGKQKIVRMVDRGEINGAKHVGKAGLHA